MVIFPIRWSQRFSLNSESSNPRQGIYLIMSNIFRKTWPGSSFAKNLISDIQDQTTFSQDLFWIWGRKTSFLDIRVNYRKICIWPDYVFLDFRPLRIPYIYGIGRGRIMLRITIFGHIFWKYAKLSNPYLRGSYIFLRPA